MSELDKAIEEEAKKSVLDEWPEFASFAKPPYKIGDKVQVKICSIVPFGAFCHTMDEHKYKGLIHISEIANEQVDVIEDYLGVGDEFEATVKAIKEKKQGATKAYKLEFSVRSLNLKPKNERPFSKLATLKDRLKVAHEELNLKKVINMDTDSTHSEKKTYVNMTFAGYPRDIQHLLTYIENVCGTVSEESRNRIIEMADKHGIFLTTKAILETDAEFTRDLSHHFLNEVENRIGDDL
ncbi:S1 RNA-binding domain-containing protein [Staphylospora marina]|uniref:S1 RNA-binding domain-containing protein n=1 Tax=Staphylospora marina TaxID=2490858 RepID=UPI000F5BDFA9|nr:S1 RNA-binding domain-containing protein [Staphylospora marina]